ncbi:MAG: hypothetical protein GY707_07895 [Desulfobacteraceae bacterium]|nr:hypothetical protein [Desulfobacteraceae bacterium]
MSYKCNYILAIPHIFLIAFILNGCVSSSVFPTKGEITTPGLPPIFVAGTNWSLTGRTDQRVDGTTLHISPSGEVNVKKHGQTIPSKIQNGEIILDGILKGCKIYANTIESKELGSLLIKGKGIDIEGDLGLFCMKDSK